MKPILTLTTFLLLIFLYSLENSNNVQAQNTNDLKLIRIISDSIIVYEYSYNETNLLSEEKSKLIYVKYNYNENGYLISTDHYNDPALFSSSMEVIEASRNKEEWTNPENTEKSYSTEYEYNTFGQLMKSSDHSGYSTFNYDNKNRISRQTYYHDDIISHKTDFEYDKRGNLTKKSLYQVEESGKKELIRKTIFKFDKNHNPYKELNNLMIPGKYTNPNNIIKEITSNYYLIKNMEDDTNTIELSYEYNQYDYPIAVDGKKIRYVYE